MEIRKATDLFKSLWEGDWKRRLSGGSFTRADFKFAVRGRQARSGPSTIRPANIARYDRDSDKDVIDAWLKDRGFCRPNPGKGDDDEDWRSGRRLNASRPMQRRPRDWCAELRVLLDQRQASICRSVAVRRDGSPALGPAVRAVRAKSCGTGDGASTRCLRRQPGGLC